MKRTRYVDGLRRCRVCGEAKPRDGFPRQGGRVCRPCKAAYNRRWYAAHKGRWTLYGARYRAKHAADEGWHDQRRLVLRLWYERHRDAVRAARRAAYWADREKALAQCRAYYRRNREKVKARNRAYYAAHRDRQRAEARAKYERLREAHLAARAERRAG